MTEVGIIPEDWEIKTFKDVFTFLPTNTYARDCMNDVEGEVQNVHYGDVLIKYGSILDFTQDDIPYFNPSHTKYNVKGQLKDGDIIFADTAEDEAVGKAVEVYAIGSHKAVSGLHTMLCRPKEGLFEPKYLGYFLNSSCYHNQLLPLMVGTKVSSVAKSAIIDTLILLPPKEEQKKIANAFAGYDNLISSFDKKIFKKKQIKEGTIQQFLTGKKRLPGFNGEWVEKSLGEVAVVRSGYPFKSETYSSLGDFIIITISNVKNGYLCLDDYNKIVSCPDDIQKHQKLKIGDIVVSMTGNVGRVCIINKPNCLLNQRVGLLQPSRLDIVDKDFLFAILNNKKFEEYLINKGQGAAQANVGNKDIESYVIYLPSSIEEQSAIASLISDMDSEIQSLESERDKYMLIKQGMMQDLLTGKTRLI